MNHILLLHSHPFRIRFDNRSAAQIHNRLRKDLCAYQKLVYNCELIRSMHLVVSLRHSCAECHAIFQMMNISAAAHLLVDMEGRGLAFVIDGVAVHSDRTVRHRPSVSPAN